MRFCRASIPEIWEQTGLAEDEDSRGSAERCLAAVTILVPAPQRERDHRRSVTAILTLEYRNFEIIVVNDGPRTTRWSGCGTRFEPL